MHKNKGSMTGLDNGKISFLIIVQNSINGGIDGV